MGSKPVLIVRNDDKEGAGLLDTLLQERGIPQHQVFGYATDFSALPAGSFSGLVILGGAQSAYETDAYPYLTLEMDLCRNFIRHALPVAGFCLGAQILARALGGEVAPGARKEIGWYELIINDEGARDPLMKDQPQRLLAYHFHGDVIQPVPGCVNLASTALTEWQLFRYAANVYGFQYHAEADLPLIEVMCRNNADYLVVNGFSAENIISASRTHSAAFEQRCKVVLNRWLDLVRSDVQQVDRIR